MAQVTSVTSEALQTQIRNLLPSQQGFGEDLQASNVIVPIIDLTATAEGSALPLDLSSAATFESTEFEVTATATDIISTTGFYKLIGSLWVGYGGTVARNRIQIVDSTPTTKNIWQFNTVTGVAGTHAIFLPIELIFFLGSGQKMTISTGTASTIVGSVRQIADISGNITNPTGYTP